MRYEKKMNRFEKMLLQKKKIEDALRGEGVYIYENNTKGDFNLPKPGQSGIKVLAPKQQFQGDSYFMSLVRSNDLRLIEVISTPENEKENMEKKLILDQPEKITNLGKIEHVVADEPIQKFNEDQVEAPEVLINEDPMEGVEIITD